MVVGADNKVEVRPVRGRRSARRQVAGRRGLAAGDRVIVDGLQKIRPGMPVQAVAAAHPARRRRQRRTRRRRAVRVPGSSGLRAFGDAPPAAKTATPGK